MGSGARFVAWLRHGRKSVRRPNATCPVCGEAVVVEPRSYKGGLSLMAAPRPDEELIAACVEHGRTPFNDATHRFLAEDDTT